MTIKSGRFWRSNQIDNATYTDNRRLGFGYDAEGNVLGTSGTNGSVFDAAGKQTSFINWRNTVGGSPNHPYVQPNIEIAQTYDAEGNPVRRNETRRTEELIGEGPNTNITETATTSYYLYSSVLGGAKVVELDSNGVKTAGYVYANGQRLAKQTVEFNSSVVRWHHPNPGSNSWVETLSTRVASRHEMDPVGAEVGTDDPFVAEPEPNYLDLKGNQPLYIDGGDPFDYSGGCSSFGMPISCSDAARELESGLGQVNGISNRRS